MVDPDDDLESTVERLRDRVDELESQLDGQSRSPATATRRDALKAGGAGALLGALGLGSITSGASADPQGRLGSPSDPVQQAYINNADVTALNAEDATIDKVGARAFLSTSQSVPTGSATQINLDSTTADDWVDAVDLSNNRITIQRSGWYLITGGVVLQGASDGTRMTSILQVNDSTISEAPDHAAKGSAIIGGQATDTRILSSGDHVTLSAFHDEGAPLNTEDDERNVYLSVFGGF